MTNKIHSLFAILLILTILLLPSMVSMAQDESPAPEVVAIALPPVLLGLIALNNRLTEAVKMYLSADELPFTPSPQLRSVIVLISSAVIGVGSAYFTPNATDWLGESFAAYPVFAILLTGFSVSLGAGAVQMVLSILGMLQQGKSTTTTLSTSGNAKNASVSVEVKPIDAPSNG